MKLPTLYKKSSTGKTSQWTIEVKDNCFRTISGFTDGEKVTSAWTCCEGKNIGKSNETTPDSQALAEAEATWKKKVEGGMYEDIKDIGTKKFFEPMLAKKLEDYIDDLKYPVLSQPKLDGIRCIVKADGMWSRKGKEIKSAPHIYESLKPLFKKDPDLVFDGEMYCDKLANDFNKICSLVKKTKPTKEDLIESAQVIEYHVYDLPSCKKGCMERLIYLSALNLPSCCVKVLSETIHNKKELEAEYENLMSQGYEGQMIRVLDGKYENKRSKNLLKNKEFVDEEFVIKGVEEGRGNLANKMGKLILETSEGKEFGAAINASWEELEKYWKERDSLIGKTATVKYFQLTNDKIPRFPKIIKIAREDYE